MPGEGTLASWLLRIELLENVQILVMYRCVARGVMGGIWIAKNYANHIIILQILMN